MNPYVGLTVAIVSEVVATTALRASDGFSRLVPSVVVVVGYAVSFAMMASILRQLQVGLVYAIWSGVGTAATAVIAWLLFKESYDPLAVAGIALVIAGVVVMNLSGSVAH